MKAYVYVKHKTHPQVDGQGMQDTDICYIMSMSGVQGTKTLNTYLPIVMDLNIPCGQGQVAGMDFETRGFHCVKCPVFNESDCDAIKYTIPVFDIKGKLIKKRKNKIDYNKFLSVASKTMIKNQNKTDIEKATVFTNAGNNEQLKSIIEEKT